MNAARTPVVALAGNPNVGKSTVFNALTGARQHTGNWSGKTVSGARGTMRCGGRAVTLVDLPGTYSLRPRSEEERVARAFLLSGEADAVVLVADATCLERNLILILQALELLPRAVVCLNLMDEARKKRIRIDVAALERELGVPVVPCEARRGRGLHTLTQAAARVLDGTITPQPTRIRYPADVEDAITASGLARAAALDALAADPPAGQTTQQLDDVLTAAAALRAEEIALSCVETPADADARDRRIDRIVLSRRFGLPLMLLLLAAVFYITLSGANVPSAWLGEHLLGLGAPLAAALAALGLPPGLVSLLVDGVWQVLATVVSVMLPPMAIFFPLFTLLEDAGYLPRVAFQLDHAFRRAHTCGKQSLTMCLGKKWMRMPPHGVRGSVLSPPDFPAFVRFCCITHKNAPCKPRGARKTAAIVVKLTGTEREGKTMQIQQLTYFVTVAEQGSINKAAEKLFVTQPNLSKAISNLESELKVRIFDRTNKGVVLTEDGKKLYQYARSIINQMELIQGLSQKERPRMLSIASYPVITMGRLISSFYNVHKQENIRIKLVEQRMQKVIESVESGESEIGFVMSNNVQVKELKHMLHFKNLEFHALGVDTWYANIGPNNPLYEQDEVTMTQLLQYPIVRLPDDYFSNLTFYLEIDGIRLTEHKKVVYVSDSAAILALLRTTDVFRFGPGLSADDYAKYGIRTIPIRNCDVQINVGWLQRKREMLSPEAQSFVALLEGLYPAPPCKA